MIKIELATALGQKIFTLDKINEMTCSIGVGRVGWFSISFPREAFPKQLFFNNNRLGIDKRVHIWRKPRGRARRLIFAGFIRRYEERGERYTYIEDYSEEWTFVYCAGSGKESARILTDIQNDTRLNASVLNRREGFYENTNEDDTGLLEDGGSGYLYDNRPFIDFVPKNVEIDWLYPNDWQIGDVLNVSSGKPDEIVISGPDFNDLLRRRIVAYKTGTSQAKKSDNADDMMKEYVYENLGAGAALARRLNAGLGFEIAADEGAGPALEYSATFGNLFEVLKEISDRSAELGTRVYFSVVPVVRGASIIPRFETRVSQWGRDLSAALRVGEGDRTQDLMVGGVEVKANSEGEQVIPILERIND